MLLLLVISGHAIADDFSNDFKSFNSQINNDFSTEASNNEKAYDETLAAYNKAYKDFSSKIEKIWKDKEVSTAKKWVQYSPDLTNRAIVDFEAEEITIEQISSSPKPDMNILRERYFSVANDNFESAISKDFIISKLNIEVGNNNNAILVQFMNGSNTKQAIVTNKVESSLISANKFQHSIKIKIPSEGYKKKAESLKETVLKFANKYTLPPSLIYAIIHTESAFNPMATSHIPAFGLMQIVPKSAGLDVALFLTGKQKIFLPDYLYSEDNNIMVGATYLHLLNSRYLALITNPQSRLYCIICAYNTGAGNVAKAFVGKTNIQNAANIINKMSPSAVYEKLINNLPYEETKHYLERVNKRIGIYNNLT